MIAAVAAGHPATAAAGAELLAAGGSAADAAVGACLASCVAETVMTGLLGGGHAVHFDAGQEVVRALDCFVSVPSGTGAPLEQLSVPFGEELVQYAIGAASCAVPGLPAGLDELWRTYGRLPWPEVVRPALRLAEKGVAMPPAHVACLQMLAPVMTLREGGRIYAPGGVLLRPGQRLSQPGLVGALELIRDEGARSVYTGTIAERLLALVEQRGGAITRADLARYDTAWLEPAKAPFAGRTVLTRAGLNGVPAALRSLPADPDADDLLAVLDVPIAAGGHTTNLATVDSSGNACVLTTSLGLGSGDWLPGLDLHLNSMLGETDLILGPLVPGARMESMMSPAFAFDAAGLELAIGAAGGTRLRSALTTVLVGALAHSQDLQAAIDRPRFHPADGIVNAEPGVDEIWLATLEDRGRPVRRWPALHHYFGGVSAIGRDTAGADPRRSGAVGLPPAS